VPGITNGPALVPKRPPLPVVVMAWLRTWVPFSETRIVTLPVETLRGSRATSATVDPFRGLVVMPLKSRRTWSCEVAGNPIRIGSGQATETGGASTVFCSGPGLTDDNSVDTVVP
jgi:hypothetical protein